MSKKADVTVPSGHTNKDFQKVLGGFPSKKSIEEIEKANTPKDAPSAVSPSR